MYTTDYLQTFIDTLALPEESRAPLRADYETLLAAPGTLDELRAAEALLFGGADWEAIVPHMDRLHACSGLHRHVVDFLFLMAASERLRADYKAAGLPDGEYMLGVNPVTVTDGDAKITGTEIRAGSTLTMAQAVKRLARVTGAAPEKVLGLLTTNPARLIGEDHCRGEIAVGRDADLVVLSDGLDVLETWSAGERVYARKTV